MSEPDNLAYMSTDPVIYLIPSVLHQYALETIPVYVLHAVKSCSVIFTENERTTRRFLKSLWKEINIDDFEWFTIHQSEEDQLLAFREKVKEGKRIAIVSEAGCPGIADPGQILIAAAQEMNITIRPLVGPSSILLALMASGMNGQQFEFVGYLPIESGERTKTIIGLEKASQFRKSTKIFIETPYRNNQLLESLLKICNPNTRLCLAAELTSENELVRTKTIANWRKEKPDLHKKPVIFLLQAG